MTMVIGSDSCVKRCRSPESARPGLIPQQFPSRRTDRDRATEALTGDPGPEHDAIGRGASEHPLSHEDLLGAFIGDGRLDGIARDAAPFEQG